MLCDVRGFEMSYEETFKSLLQMYKDGVKFITDEQLIIFMIDNNVGVHIAETGQSVIKKLCYLCKLLSPEQMKKVRETRGLSAYVNLHGWYYTHLYEDFMECWQENDKESMDKYQKEIERIGCKICYEEEGTLKGRPYLKDGAMSTKM